MRVFALSPADIRDRWEDFRPLLEDLERGRGEPCAENVRAAALVSKCQVFGLHDGKRVVALTVTEIHTVASGKVCVILGAQAAAQIPPVEVLAQAQLLNEIGRWAASIGCQSVRMSGRRGWLRRFRRFNPSRDVIGEWTLAPSAPASEPPAQDP